MQRPRVETERAIDFLVVWHLWIIVALGYLKGGTHFGGKALLVRRCWFVVLTPWAVPSDPMHPSELIPKETT